MYDQIQNFLTSTIEFVAIAGLGGIVIHAIYSWHLSQIPAAPKRHPAYKRCELVTEILETLQAEGEQISECIESLEVEAETTEPEQPALIDPWQTEIITSSPRYWVQTQPKAQPTLYLLPPAKEVKETKQPKTRKATTKSKAPAKKQTTRKRKVA